MIYYNLVCKRKLWLSVNHISLEEENENVSIGKFLDENTYSRNRKHIMINNEINLDFIEKGKLIHEIKKSRKIEEASIWQVRYYLFYLENQGVSGVKAKIDYPLLKRVVEVDLNHEDKEKIDEMISEIQSIISLDSAPQFIRKGICRKCAFEDLCCI